MIDQQDLPARSEHAVRLRRGALQPGQLDRTERREEAHPAMQQFFRCNICDAAYPSQNALDAHARLAHPGATAMELATQLTPGMAVIGSDGISSVGTIKE